MPRIPTLSLLPAGGRAPLLLLLALPALLSACSDSGSVDELLASAREAARQGQADTAVVQYKTALQEQPDHVAARHELGVVYLEQMHRPRFARKELERALELSEGGPPPGLREQLVRAMVEEGAPDDALPVLAAAGDLPAAVRDRLQGDVALRRGDPEAAADFYRAALKSAPEAAGPGLGLARVDWESGRRERALEQVTALAARWPDDVQVLETAGEYLVDAGRMDEARPLLEALIRKAPARPQARVDLARLLLRAGAAEAAAPHVARVRAHPWFTYYGLYLAGVSARLEGRDKDAERLLQDVLKVAPEHYQSLAILGDMAYRDGRFERAIEFLKRAVKRRPRHLATRKLLAAAQGGAGDHQGAVATLDSFPEGLPRDASYIASLSAALAGAGRFDDATRYQSLAVELAPDAGRLRAQLGVVKLYGGGGDDALLDIREATRLSPDDGWLKALQIRVLLNQGHGAEAAAAARAALEGHPDDVIVLNYLATAELMQGRRAEARPHLERAVSLNRRYATAAVNLARLDLLEGRREAARERVEAVLREQPDTLLAQLLLAQMQFDEGDLPAVERTLEAALEAHPGDVEARLRLSELLLLQGKAEQALELVRTTRELAPRNLAVMRQSVRLERAGGDPERALADLERLIAASGETQELLRGKARLLALLGRPDEARALVERMVNMWPGEPGPRVGLANLAIDRGDYAAADRAVRDVPEDSPLLSDALLVRAQAALATGDTRRVIAIANRLRERQPQSAIPYNLLASAHLATGDVDQARRWLEESAKRRTGDMSAILNLAKLDHQAGRLDAARSGYEQVLGRVPRHSTALLALASIDSEQGRVAEAVGKLEAVRETNPGDVLSRVLLADHFIRLGDLSRAQTLKDEVLSVRPRWARGHVLAASVAVAQGDGDAAARALETAESLAQGDPNVFQRTSEVWAEARDWGRARQASLRGLELAPKHAGLKLVLAEALLGGGDAAGAGKVAAGIRVAGGGALQERLLRLRGDLATAGGDLEAATAAYQAAMAVNRSRENLLRLALAQVATGDVESASGHLADWLDRKPEDVRVRSLLAEVLIVGGRLEQATAQLNTIVQAFPEHEDSLNKLANLSDMAGRREEAVEFAKRAASRPAPTAATLDTYGWLLVQQGDLENGIAQLERAAGRREELGAADRASLDYHLAAAHSRSGNVRRAVELLTGLLATRQPFPERKDAEALELQLKVLGQ